MILSTTVGKTEITVDQERAVVVVHAAEDDIEIPERALEELLKTLRAKRSAPAQFPIVVEPAPDSSPAWPPYVAPAPQPLEPRAPGWILFNDHGGNCACPQCCPPTIVGTGLPKRHGNFDPLPQPVADALDRALAKARGEL